MSTIFIIIFFIPFWEFLRFCSKGTHEFDLLLDSVANRTALIYSHRSFCYKTWRQWHLEIKIFKILLLFFLTIFFVATQIIIIVTMLFDIQNGAIRINMIIRIICSVLLIVAIYYIFRYLRVFVSVYFNGINYISENNKKVIKSSKFETKSIAFIKALDIERPYPCNRMTYEFRNLDYNWDVVFTGKFDILVGYYAILFITIGLTCFTILIRIMIWLFKRFIII